MKPHELVAELVARAGGSLPAAKAMGYPKFQGTLYKLAAGDVSSPTRATAERVAKFFGIPIDALYSEQVATRVWNEMQLSENDARYDVHLSIADADDPAPEGVAQSLSHLGRRVSPPVRDWETLMDRPLEEEFQLTMPDASMAPEIPRGAGIVFITRVTPEPEDFVLIVDRDGRTYVREYKQRGGEWEAHAINPAYLPMEAKRDGLRVLAVCNGVLGRRAHRR